MFEGVDGGLFSLHPVASLAASSVASLPGTPTWARIQLILG